MNVLDIVVAAIVVVWVTGIILYRIFFRRGKGHCENCSACGKCNRKGKGRDK